VEGDLIAANVLDADEIEFEGNEARISGIVNEVDADNDQVVVMGILVDVSNAELEDSEGDVEPFALDDLMAGDFVELEGREVSNVVVAEELERDEADESELRGLLDDFDETAGTVTILGELINTDDQTVYEIDDMRVSAAAFYDRLHIDQSVVEAEWSSAQADTLSPALELSLED
jgi:hypothetical protein